MDEKVTTNESNKNTLSDAKARSSVQIILSQLVTLIRKATLRLVGSIKPVVSRCIHCLNQMMFVKQTKQTKQTKETKETKQHKRRIYFMYIIIAVVVILFGLSMILVTHMGRKNVHHGPSAVSNLMRINNMQDSLGKIQSKLAVTSQMTQAERQHVNSQLQMINTRLGQVSNSVGVSHGQQIKALRATLQSNRVNLTQKIRALNAEINTIKTKVFPAPTLSAKALPFNVVAIEPWNGTPYVEIRQKQNTTMVDYVGLYGVRGGWKVINLDAPDQTATFLSERGQIVHVSVTFNEQTKA